MGRKVFFCSYLYYGTYFLAMLVGSVKNTSLFQKFTLNLIGFRVCDLSETIRCHSSLPVCLIETWCSRSRRDRYDRVNIPGWGISFLLSSVIFCKLASKVVLN